MLHSPSAGVSFGLKASPFAGRLRRRISTGSMPSAAAASFSCDSTAHDACGVPNPLNAVLGVVCDSSARAAMRACGGAIRPACRIAGLADDARCRCRRTRRAESPPGCPERRCGRLCAKAGSRVDARGRAAGGLKRFFERQHEPHRPPESEREPRHQRLDLRPALCRRSRRRDRAR